MKPNTRLFAVFAFLYLALAWGSSFILMKKALLGLSPLQIAAVRMSLAGIVMIPLVIKYLREVKKKDLLPILLVGVIGNGIPAFLFPFAEQVIDSATVGILNVLTPVFAFLLGVVFFNYTFSFRKLIGILMGLGGAVLLILSGNQHVDMTEKIGYASLVILATVCYGTGVNITKRYLQDTHTLIITSFSLVAVSVIYTIYLLLTDFTSDFLASPDMQQASIYVGILAILGTSLALILFNRLIQVTDQVVGTTITYLIPIVALGWGWTDREQIGLTGLVSMLIIFSGIYLVNRKPKPKNLAQ